MPEQTTEVNRLARVLIAAWEQAEEKPVNASYVATFADMARAVLADQVNQADGNTTRDDVLELRLCETEFLILRANRRYVFSVDPDCERCVAMHATYSPEPADA